MVDDGQRHRAHKFPTQVPVFTSRNTSGRFTSTSAKIWRNDSTAKSRPLTLKGPTSTPDLILLRNLPLGAEQFLVRAPGFPNFLNMILSVAELKLVLIVSLGGIGTRSRRLLTAALLSSGLGLRSSRACVRPSA
jgi:hypothetical protein